MSYINSKLNDFLERLNNFFDTPDPLTIQDESFYIELQGLSEMLDADMQKLRGAELKERLKTICLRIFNFIVCFNDDYSIFNENKNVHDAVFNACFFTALCMFLYNTKRIKGKSQRKYIYERSSLKYNEKKSPNYFDYENTNKESVKSKSIISEETKFRQYRYRFLSERSVYNDSPEWSAIRKVSEHEWSLYFELENADPDIQETFKRIKKLYHGINTALLSPMDDEYEKRLEVAYNKFESNLKKIKYENVLKFDKYCLNHIRKDQENYGINLYRFEKELRLYTIIKEVNQLLRCNNEDEERCVLTKSIILSKIFFPKLYEYLNSFKEPERIELFTNTFFWFLDEFTLSCYLVLDKFVENDSLGTDWESLFLKTINEMTETVFYDPEKIDYSVVPKSQEEFVKILSVSVKMQITYWKHLSQYMDIMPPKSNDKI